MQPDSGGRLEARLLGSDAHGARYQLDLATKSGTWSASAQVSSEQGEVNWGTWSGGSDPPDWLCRYARSALRGAWRDRNSGGWPRRLTRWREMPAPGGRDKDGSE